MTPPSFQRPARTELRLTFGGRLLLPLAAAGLVATWLAGGTSGLFSATAFGLLLGVPLAARFAMRGLELSLPGTHHLPVGQARELRLLVHQRTRPAVADVMILAGADPRGEPRPIGAFGRIAPGATAEVPILLRFFERGRFRRWSCTLVSTHPFGLYRVAQVFELEVDLWAVPRLGRVHGLALPAGHTPQAALHARQASPGELEFVGVRPWREGESLRRIHWPLSARADRWVTRVLRDEHDPPLHLCLVTFVQQPGLWERRDASFEKAVSLFATVAARELEWGRSITLSLSTEPEGRPMSLRGPSGLTHLLRRLAELAPRPGDPWAALPAAVRQFRRRGADLVLVLAGGARGVAPPEGMHVLDVDEPWVARHFAREVAGDEVGP